MQKKDVIIGILGGAGPDATIDLQIALSKAMKVQGPIYSDQDHFRVITDNNTTIADRSLAITGKGPSPLPEIIHTVKNLTHLGCNIILYPCNTAHVFLPEIQRQLNVNLLDMVGISCQHIRTHYPDMKKLGILCTDITKQYQLYERFSTHTCLYPEPEVQAKVMLAIFLAKAGFCYSTPKNIEPICHYLQQVSGYSYAAFDLKKSAHTLLKEAAEHLIQKGCEGIILGCTEIPLCISAADIQAKTFNPTQILANAAIQEAFGLLEASCI